MWEKLGKEIAEKKCRREELKIKAGAALQKLEELDQPSYMAPETEEIRLVVRKDDNEVYYVMPNSRWIYHVCRHSWDVKDYRTAISLSVCSVDTAILEQIVSLSEEIA